ncbi:spermidine/putrescine ABC transporter ATP-binding protein, partial [Paenibacillus riograndensis]
MKEGNRVLSLYTLLVFIFLLGPLVIISITSFEPGTVLKFPPEGFSLRWYKNIFEVSAFMETCRTSIVISLLGNLLALLLGGPAAYALSRYRVRGGERR